MKRMTPKVLRGLVKMQKDIQITIYLPILSGPENTATNTSALHHAVSLLKKTFTENEITKENQQAFTHHITELEQILSRPMSGKSLAIFITDFNQLMVYEVPFAVETAIYFMAPHMQLEPLNKHYAQNANYWVLVLSQKGCSLLCGNGENMKYIAAADLSLDLKTALAIDEITPDIQARPVGLAHGRVSEGFHGHGGFRDIKKKYLENYLRLINKRLEKYLGHDTAPIYLVGLSGSQRAFTKVSRRRNVQQTHLSLDTHHMGIADIQRLLRQQITTTIV